MSGTGAGSVLNADLVHFPTFVIYVSKLAAFQRMRILWCCFYGGRKLNYACLKNAFLIGDSTTTIIIIIIKVSSYGDICQACPTDHSTILRLRCFFSNEILGQRLKTANPSTLRPCRNVVTCSVNQISQETVTNLLKIFPSR